ncbi:MAG TPA: antitoxin Xre-like helix-turn-helix domain-containing protein [Gemmatimonadales bacterium]|nr:antitoxin Xre-like helix-turn-helix domain-containing protein [Gemmatimonadales bacterium]
MPRTRSTARRIPPKRSKPQEAGARSREAVRPTAELDELWKRLLPEGLVESVYAMAPIRRVALVKEGAPPEAVDMLAQRMAITRERLYTMLGVPRATIKRKQREGSRLSQDESERVVGLARLVGQVEQMVHDSGDPKGFDAGRWVAAWLDRPLPALGGVQPSTLMDTAEGREIVSGLLAQMQSGTFA